MSAGPSAHVHAPAKINLGLEITGRRQDGYHEIRSVLAMVDLVDDLRVTLDTNLPNSRVTGIPEVAAQDNLITRAITAFRSYAQIENIYDVCVHKQIPAPSGLGGASSNAAATLLALNGLHGHPLSEDELHLLGAQLGSDVPFFLGSAAASVSGTGTSLTPLPAPSGWVLIVVPSVDLPAKTATLYSRLTPRDFTDGRRAEEIAEHLSSGRTIPVGLLHNAFERPLGAIAPDITNLVTRMAGAGCPHVALSGAGPAHYTLFPEEGAANEVARRISGMLKPGERLLIAPFRATPLSVELR